MIRTTFRISLRSFRANKLITMGLVLCLFLGILSSTLMVVYLRQVLEKDDFNSRKKDIYLVAYQESPLTTLSSIRASEYLNLNYNDYPEIETSTCVGPMNTDKNDLVLKGQTFHPEVLVVDSNFLKVFDFQLLMGDRKTVLHKDGGMVLTQKLAHKLFGTENPVGKTLEYQKQTFTIEGVVENTSVNSSIFFDILVRTNPSLPSFIRGELGAEYLLTIKGFNADVFNKKLHLLTRKFSRLASDEVLVLPFEKTYFKFSTQQYFNLFQDVVYRTEDREALWPFLTLVLVVLIITISNYATLQRCLSRSESKSMRFHRLNGASTASLLGLQAAKTTLMIVPVGLLTVLIFYALLPSFNQLAGFRLNASVLDTATTIFASLAIVVVAGWHKPRTNHQTSFRKSNNHSFKENLSRKPVLILQFVLSVTLIFVTLVVNSQLKWMMQQHPGLDVKGVVLTNLPEWTYEELVKNPYVESYTAGTSPFKPESSSLLRVMSRPESNILANGLIVQPGYEDVFGLKLMEGRYFDLTHEPPPHDFLKVVINEAAKKAWQIKDIKTQYLYSDFGNYKYEIIGVVEDFNYQHMAFKPKPLVMICIYNYTDQAIVRFKKGAEESGLASLKKLYKEKVDAKGNLDYTFIQTDADALYTKEKQLSHLCFLFTMAGLLITLVGLFTLVYAETQRRVKEIGIRKVNGAGIPAVLLLLQRDLIQAFALAFVLSCPIGWFVMHRWLEHFAYHISLSWWLFALAGLIAFAVAFVAVIGLSWRAATRNPVESLRNE